MKLLGVEFGRVSLLVDLLDLGTRTGMYLPEAAAMVQQRYAFVHAPTLPPSSQQQQMYRFEHGKFGKGDKKYTLSAFEVHPHGLVIQATDTNAGDAFFEDFFEFGVEHLEMKRPSRPPGKIYLSSLLIEFGKEFNAAFKKWEALSGLFSAQLKETYGLDNSVQVASVAFKPDPQTISPRLSALLSEFSLDRRIYEPYEHQRFIASAPLRTDDHIALLKHFEKIAL